MIWQPGKNEIMLYAENKINLTKTPKQKTK